MKTIRLQSGDGLPAIDQEQPFKAIVLVEEAVSEIWRWDVCRWLVVSGCRVAMIWGPQCKAWVESIEEASLEAADYADIPPDSRLVVTSHEDEDLSDVFWFARHKASHPVHAVRDTLIVHVSPQDRQSELEALFAQA